MRPIRFRLRSAILAILVLALLLATGSLARQNIRLRNEVQEARLIAAEAQALAEAERVARERNQLSAWINSRHSSPAQPLAASQPSSQPMSGP
jgi:hypothetical protein